MFNSHTADQLSKIFKAVADPTRQKILFALRHEGELTVSELTARLHVTQPTVSQHLRILKEVDALLSRKDGQQVYYRLCSNRLCDALGDFIKAYQQEVRKSQKGDGRD